MKTETIDLANEVAHAGRDLCHAVLNQDVQAASGALERGAALARVTLDGEPLLFLRQTWELGAGWLVAALLEGGANPHQLNSTGATLLHAAVCFGSADLVELVIRHGVNLEARSWGLTPLHVAIIKGDEAMVRRLLAFHADASAVTVSGFTLPGRSCLDLVRDAPEHSIVGIEAALREVTDQPQMASPSAFAWPTGENHA